MYLNRVKERFKWSMISCGKKVTTSHRSQIALAAYRWLSMKRPKHGSRTEQRTTRRIQFPATLKRDERLRQRRSEPRVNTDTPTIHVHPDGARVSVVCVCVCDCRPRGPRVPRPEAGPAQTAIAVGLRSRMATQWRAKTPRNKGHLRPRSMPR